MMPARKARRLGRVWRACLAGAFAVWWATGASAEEVCRFSGTTDYNGHAELMARADQEPSGLTVDVQGRFEASGWLWHVRLFVEEVSLWRDGALVSVAVNGRYLSGDHVVRQQWDKFDRDGAGLAAERVQGKTLAEFARHFAGFARHWDLGSFGAPWLADFEAAGAERRPDLDLARVPEGVALRTPLAMAFYWVRFLPASESLTDVFLPGFKGERVVSLPIVAENWGGGNAYRTVVRHPALSARTASTAAAWVGQDRRIARVSFSLHAPRGSASGVLQAEGCEGDR